MLALKHDHQIINRFDVFGYHGDMVVFEGPFEFAVAAIIDLLQEEA